MPTNSSTLEKDGHFGANTLRSLRKLHSCRDPQAAASTLLYMLKDPLHMRCILGVQETVSEAEIREHVEQAVSRFLELHAPG